MKKCCLFILKAEFLEVIFVTCVIHCIASNDISDLCSKLEFDIVVATLNKEKCPRVL